MVTRRAFTLSAMAASGLLAGRAAPSRSDVGPDEYFDLQRRAEAAIHCLTSLLDERQGHLPYFDVKYDARPPLAVHIRWDYGDGVGRYVDALRLARTMCGSTENRHADAALEAWLFRLLGEHGLSWWPKSPYETPHPSGQPGQVADVTWTQRSTLMALSTLYAATDEARYAAAGRRLVDGLNHIAVWSDGMAYFPDDATRGRPGDVLYPPGGWSGRGMLTAGWFGAILGTLIWPLARFAGETDYEPAVRLAGGLAEFILRATETFHANGRFRDLLQGHFYARTTTANGLLRLGVLTANRSYVAMAEQIYRHAKEWGTSFGWFPEDLSTPGCETCCTKDMIELAIGLALHVNSRYWQDAERFGRNHLLESQLLQTDWIKQYRPPRTYEPPAEDASRISRDSVMERWKGGFAGWSSVNDWVFPGKGGMACCNASGARALYDLWHYGITSEDEVSVNLLFTRASPDVIVKSYLPFMGRVELRRKTDVPIRLQLSEDIPTESIAVDQNGESQPIHRTGSWLHLPPGKPGDALAVQFPLAQQVETVHIGYTSYRVLYRGDTVLSVSPPGRTYPLYQRDFVADRLSDSPDVVESGIREIDSI